MRGYRVFATTRTTVLCGLIALAAVTSCAAGLAGLRPAGAGGAARSIGPSSSAAEVIEFAETSRGRWGSVVLDGHTVSGGRTIPFRVWVDGQDRSRFESGNEVRIRNGSDRLRLDLGAGTSRSSRLPRPSTSKADAMAAAMTAARADDPILAQDGELLLDTPVNDLVSPAYMLRREIRNTAVEVVRGGSATVAGRPAEVITARFPAELAKEDHWDLYIDAETGVLLGFAIEPLPGQDGYRAFADRVQFDASISPSAFDCGATGIGGRGTP